MPERSEILSTAALIEGYMQQGYTTPESLRRIAMFRKFPRGALQSYIDAIQERWLKGEDRQKLDTKRATIKQQYLQNLRQLYTLAAEASQSTEPTARADRIKIAAQITRTLQAIATLEGLNQSVHKVVGDPNQPVTIRQEVDVGVFAELAANDLLNADDIARLDAALIGDATRARTGESGGLWSVDATATALPAPSGDHRSGPTEDVE